MPPSPQQRAPQRVESAERELARLRCLAALFEHLGPVASWDFDVASKQVSCSRESLRLLEIAGERTTLEIDELLARAPESERASFVAWLDELAAGAQPAAFEHRLLASDDVERRLTHHAIAERDASGRCTHVHGLISSAAAPMVAVGSAASAAEGPRALLDREAFVEQVDRAVLDAQRTATQIAVLFVDVNRGKLLTTGLPHRAAEDLSAAIARRLRDGLRERDVVAQVDGPSTAIRIARVRGDEFTLLLPQLARAQDTSKIAARLLEKLSQPFDVGGHEIYVTAEIGVACFPGDHHDAEELVRRAETAAYCARQEGHGAVKFYAPSMDSKAFERLTLETSLRRALERNELLLYYQPRVEIQTHRVAGFEALCRWKHPDLGFVSPSQFIPLAEETGLIIPIGEWVMREACRQNRAWQAAGLPPVRMSVNIASAQFRQPALYDMVCKTLSETGLDARWLELELTESTLMHDSASAVEGLKRLKSAGVRLAIDDFGTGYSSLAYLKRFPIDMLKIDRSFIREATTNPDDAAIVTSIILMGRSLKLGVVAEGVETQSQLAFLRVMQCDEVQGYLYSPPVPADEAGRILANGLRLSFAA